MCCGISAVMVTVECVSHHNHNVSSGYGHKSNSLASPFKRISEYYKLAWADFYCYHEHPFQQPQLIHSCLHVTTTESAVFHIRTAICPGRLKGFPQSSLFELFLLHCAFCREEAESNGSARDFKKDYNRLIPHLLALLLLYNCWSEPRWAKLGTGWANNSSVNPFCLNVVIQTKISSGVTSTILLPLYSQSKPPQNCKNL